MAVRQIAYRGLPQKPVLAADTTVVFDDQILGKPEDAEHAARILRALSGREHQVLTAVALALREQVETQISVSSVWFRELTDADIRRYCASRRAARQGRRLRHPGARGRVRDADSRKLFRYHGAAARGNRGAAEEIRHPPVVSLAMAVTEEILVNVTPQETRVAVIEQGVTQEVHIERASSRGLVGNIYMGRVSRVLPGMQSAFIDIGGERAAFLHVADIWGNRANGRQRAGRSSGCSPRGRTCWCRW